MTSAAIVLPGGLWRDGVRHQEAVLRPLAGADELFLMEDGASLLPAQRVTVLLARCLERLGLWQPVTPRLVRELTVGDREALLLHLRRATLGERIECVLRCPRAACRERMDLDLAVGDLLVPPYAGSDCAPAYEIEFMDSGACRRLRFRLPTGGDQEEAALLARTDVTAAAGRLLERCIETDETVETGAAGDTASGRLPAAWAARLGERMAELDPQAELVLHLVCPVCGQDFAAPFDTAAFFFHELAGRAAALYREVHRLALAYHWSEAEILALDGRRRRLYLELLAESAAGPAQ